MYAGIRATGDRAFPLTEDQYRGPSFPVAVFYGFTPTLRRIMADYVREGLKAVYIDLGYWGREGLTGYHKIAVNDRHPTAYFQNVKHSHDRLEALRVSVEPWKPRAVHQHILLAGMGDKAAAVEGKRTEAWERDAIDVIKRYSRRRIVYRPKPSWTAAKPISGTTFSVLPQQLGDVLADCHAVVTHHSNVAVEAIVAGVPAFCWKGLAAPMSSQDLSRIEDPIFPEGRRQWAADIAYTQWNIAEMMSGKAWRHLKHEGLI